MSSLFALFSRLRLSLEAASLVSNNSLPRKRFRMEEKGGGQWSALTLLLFSRGEQCVGVAGQSSALSRSLTHSLGGAFTSLEEGMWLCRSLIKRHRNNCPHLDGLLSQASTNKLSGATSGHNESFDLHRFAWWSVPVLICSPTRPSGRNGAIVDKRARERERKRSAPTEELEQM